MFFFEIPIDVSVENLYQIAKDEANQSHAPLETTMNHPFISSVKPLFMNQKTPSQLRQGALSKSWCRFTKAGVIAAVLAAAAVPVAQADLVNVYGTLSIAPTGILNVQDNNVVVRVGSLTTITGYITTGLYNGPGGFWDGPGINSSVAAVDLSQLTGVGVLDNGFAGYAMWPVNGLTGLPTPNAVTLTGPEILVKHTWFGDADLDGIITGGDQTLYNDGFNNGFSGWVNGDFDYNGTIDGGDQSLLNASFNGGGQTILLVSQGGIASVPEPTGIALMSVGIFGLLAKRRKHRE